MQADPGGAAVGDTSKSSLQRLALLFSHIDATIVRCWTGKCLGSACTSFSSKRATRILRTLREGAQETSENLAAMDEYQQADLLITWQWIRNRIWHLASTHGLTTADGNTELSASHAIDIGKQTALLCKSLSYASMEAHGTGFVGFRSSLCIFKYELTRIRWRSSMTSQQSQQRQSGAWCRSSVETTSSFRVRDFMSFKYSSPS